MYDINNSCFKYPIEYQNKKKVTDKNLVEDLELLNGKDESTSLFDIIYSPQTKMGKHFLYKISKYYTNDKNYLKDNQILIKKIAKTSDNIINKECVDKIEKNEYYMESIKK